MLKQYTLRMPGAVFGGENSLDNLTNLVKDTAKVAVFTDKGIEATGLADLVTAKIGQAGKEYVVFDELPAEPSYQQAQAAIDAFKASQSWLRCSKLMNTASRNCWTPRCGHTSVFRP